MVLSGCISTLFILFFMLFCTFINLYMSKGKDKIEKTIVWDKDQSKFMLGWVTDFVKEQHVGFKIKKQNHFKCAEALNRQFNMGVNATQVERHYSHYKTNWKSVHYNTFDLL
jgi:hypothetical protein